MKNLSFALIVVLCAFYGAGASITQKLLDEEVVPDVVDSLPELKSLKITYPSGVTVNLGNVLTPTQVKDQPTVEFEADKGAFYTLLMTDPDAPSRKEPSRREFRHWLTMNIPGSDLSSGETFFQFIGSGPPQGTGLHRYIFFLFEQPKGKVENSSPFVSDHSAQGRPSTSTRDLIKKFGLKPVAGNFYQAEYDDYVPTLHKQLGF